MLRTQPHTLVSSNLLPICFVLNSNSHCSSSLFFFCFFAIHCSVFSLFSFVDYILLCRKTNKKRNNSLCVLIQFIEILEHCWWFAGQKILITIHGTKVCITERGVKVMQYECSQKLDDECLLLHEDALDFIVPILWYTFMVSLLSEIILLCKI